MMSSDFHFRDKIPVVILGATGCVGQKFVEMLSVHPWFEIVALCASERSVGKAYGDVVNWLLPTPIPPQIAAMTVLSCALPLPVDGTIAFSGLDASIAGEVETAFAEAGYIVVSNSRNHRMDEDVPLVVAEVNPGHLELAKKQAFAKGKIITNPNCSVIGLTVALKPLIEAFGLEEVHVVTLQAISGAGYPGVASLDILDNVIPYIAGEEEKIETEPLKIFGTLEDLGIKKAAIPISAQCNRVPVTHGHMACVSVKLKKAATAEQIKGAWRSFQAEPQLLNLPTAPFHPIYYFDQVNYPQPKINSLLDKGMAVSIGRLGPQFLNEDVNEPHFGFKFTLLSHNTVRGAVGTALLNAELLVKKGWIYW